MEGRGGREESGGENWGERELREVELGDRRLEQRLQRLAAELAARPQAPINHASEDSTSLNSWMTETITGSGEIGGQTETVAINLGTLLTSLQEVVGCSVKKVLSRQPSLSVTIDFSNDLDDFCHRECYTMPEKCPSTTQLRKLS